MHMVEGSLSRARRPWWGLLVVAVGAGAGALGGPVGCGGFSGREIDASATRPLDEAGMARQDPPSSPGTPVPADASLPPGVSLPSAADPKLRVACGENGEACTVAGHVCCGGETWESSTCEASCPRALVLACDDPGDCERGAVCCGKLANAKREVVASVCRAKACEAGELALCVRGDQCGSGRCEMARPQFLSRCE